MSTLVAKKLKHYVFLVCFLAFAFVLNAFYELFTNYRHVNNYEEFIKITIFILLNGLTEIFPVMLPKGGQVTVSLAINVTILYLFLPFQSTLIITFEYFLFIFFYYNKIEKIKLLFNLAQFIVSINLASYVTQFLSLYTIKWMAVLCGAIVYVTINLLLVTIVISLAQSYKIYDVWMLNFKNILPNFLALIPMGILMAKIYEAWGAMGILMFILPLMLARHSFKLYMDTRQMYLDTVQALVTAIEAKDLYTKGHSERVAEFAVETARELDWPEHKIETLRYMALLHDIGKIAIPDVILNKSTRLSPQEYNRIKDHAVVGAEILKQVKNLGDAYLMVRHHHERMDGSGYPDGLKGEEIPMGARIIAVADCFDAMTSNRVYRAGRSPREAIQELQKCGGTELDSQVVQAFVQAWEKRLASKWEKQILTEIETGAARGEIAAAQAEE
ncbi:hypothetical protein JDF658_05020 [Carboxydocella sp. JDF658]|nr:hypothetical protein JDF658_05020 [Carboxydocella sp. JDF658]